MSKKQVKDIGEELKQINKRKLAIDISSGLMGAAAGFATERMLESAIPETGCLYIDIPLKVGKIALSVYVGDKVTEQFNKEITEIVDKSEDFWKEMMDELDDINDDDAEEIFVEVEVEEVN